MMSIEKPLTPPPSSERIRSGGPFVVSFLRNLLASSISLFLLVLLRRRKAAKCEVAQTGKDEVLNVYGALLQVDVI